MRNYFINYLLSNEEVLANVKVQLPIPTTVTMKAEAWLNVKVQYYLQYPNRLQSYNASIGKIVVLTKLESKESVL